VAAISVGLRLIPVIQSPGQSFWKRTFVEVKPDHPLLRARDNLPRPAWPCTIYSMATMLLTEVMTCWR